VYPVYLKLENPLTEDTPGFREIWDEVDAKVDQDIKDRYGDDITGLSEEFRLGRYSHYLKQKGFDGILSQGGELTAEGFTVNVFSQDQVRSVNAAFDPDFSDSPRVLSQQNFSNINITETVADEAGNIVEVTQSAQVLWEEQLQRTEALENLRGCVNG